MWILNRYLHYHFVPEKFLQAKLIISNHNEVEADEPPHWNWRLQSLK